MVMFSKQTGRELQPILGKYGLFAYKIPEREQKANTTGSKDDAANTTARLSHSPTNSLREALSASPTTTPFASSPPSSSSPAAQETEKSESGYSESGYLRRTDGSDDLLLGFGSCDLDQVVPFLQQDTEPLYPTASTWTGKNSVANQVNTFLTTHSNTPIWIFLDIDNCTCPELGGGHGLLPGAPDTISQWKKTNNVSGIAYVTSRKATMNSNETEANKQIREQQINAMIDNTIQDLSNFFQIPESLKEKNLPSILTSNKVRYEPKCGTFFMGDSEKNKGEVITAIISAYIESMSQNETNCSTIPIVFIDDVTQNVKAVEEALDQLQRQRPEITIPRLLMVFNGDS